VVALDEDENSLDALIHELWMTIEGMPQSFLIKQCREKIKTLLAKSSLLPEMNYSGAEIS